MTLSQNIQKMHFPEKIYQILENESPDIIRWHTNERAFRIFDHSRFESEIIPKYFRRKHSNLFSSDNMDSNFFSFVDNQLSSVQRQLNLYGFKCVGRGEDKGYFFHPKFSRSNLEGVKQIRRFTTPTNTYVSSFPQTGGENQKSPSVMTKLYQDSQLCGNPSDIVAAIATANANMKRKMEWQWPSNGVSPNPGSMNSCTPNHYSQFINPLSSNHSHIHFFNTPSALTARLGFVWPHGNGIVNTITPSSTCVSGVPSLNIVNVNSSQIHDEPSMLKSVENVQQCATGISNLNCEIKMDSDDIKNPQDTSFDEFTLFCASYLEDALADANVVSL